MEQIPNKDSKYDCKYCFGNTSSLYYDKNTGMCYGIGYRTHRPKSGTQPNVTAAAAVGIGVTVKGP